MPRRYSKQDLRILASSGLGAELPAPPPRRKNVEMQMQMAIISWWHGACDSFNVPEQLLWHTPNGSVFAGSKENRERIGAMMKRQGAREGVPDLFLAVPACHVVQPRPHQREVHYSGLFIEMKAPNGVVSAAQKLMLNLLETRGYQTAVCWTVEDAKKVITEHLRQ